MRHLNLSLDTATVVVQGFGNVGSHTARIMHEVGAKVIAISDRTGGLYNAKGLDIPALLRLIQEDKIPLRTKLGDWITNEELLELPCTILVPAALSEQITKDNAARVRCRILAEGANGPTTLEADPILADQGVFIIPDILANARRGHLSYFEWVQDAQRFFWKATDIRERLHEIITDAFQRTMEFSTRQRTSMRMAALMNGIDRVAQAHLARGLYP